MEKFVVKPENKDDSDSNSDSDSDISSLSDNNSVIDDSEDYSNSGIKDAVEPLTFFSSKELCYYKTIHKFFKNCGDKEIIRMLDIINGESPISLRVLDWFVTRYSKRKIDFIENEQNTIDSFDVHISYKSELKSYKKRYFDPFRRRKKFYYPLYLEHLTYTKNTSETQNSNGSKEIILLYTTLGQLNFFVWAISNKIIDYVEKNLEQISKAMNTNNKDEKKKKQKIAYKKKDKDKIKIKPETEKNVEKPIKVKKEESIKKSNSNNVFNNYYEDDEDNNELILNFD
jgi:hypothetical protein